MRRILIAGLALGFGLLGAATDAGAQGERRACIDCGGGTTTRYKTIYPVYNVTRYHDRAVYHHVTRLHYVVDVTRVQPIVRYNDVTRLHHYTIVQDAYAYQQPQPIPVVVPYAQPCPVSTYGCVCDGLE